jgi:hypothetical protein
MKKIILYISDKDSDASTIRSFLSNHMTEAAVVAKVNSLIEETGYRKVIVQAELENCSEFEECLEEEGITIC